MNEEKSLAQIAREAFWATTNHSAQDMYDRVAKAVEAEVLKRLNKSEVEPVGGQELTFVQVAQWVEKHGSTNGLQWWGDSGKRWNDEEVTTIYASVKYRVAPNKVNDPDDPTTWEKGVAIFRRDSEDETWVLDTFIGYSDGVTYKYHSEHSAYKHAKLATADQIEAWNKTQED